MKPTISILTAWYEHPELIPDYEASVRGADEVLIIDNGSSPPVTELLLRMCNRLPNARVIRFASNQGYAVAVNFAMTQAIGDIFICLNNDIKAEAGWLDRVRQDVPPGAMCGLHANAHYVDGAEIPYIDGWCTAAYRDVWQALKGYDTDTYTFAYYEDCDLSFRAVLHGYKLRTFPDWPLVHLNGGNTTSRPMAEIAYAHSEANRAKFFERVRATMRQEATA